MKNRPTSTLLLVLFLALVPGCRPTSSDVVKSDLPAELAARAEVPVEAARATAQAAVPGAELVAEELEEEDGRLIYSFDLATAGSPGIDEVTVDAIDGSLLGIEHEDVATERAEAAQDAAQLPSPPSGAPQ